MTVTPTPLDIGAGTVLDVAGGFQAFRGRAGSEEHRAGRPRLRGAGTGRRQRGRQVHAGQDDRRRLHRRRRVDGVRRQAGPVGSPAEAQQLGIATVFQDLALCDNLDVVANLYLGREPPARTALLDEVEMERSSWELLRQLSREDPVGPRSRSPACPAASGRPSRSRASLLGEPERRHAGRADGCARRSPDGQGAEPGRAAARTRARRDPDQPQHRRREAVADRVGCCGSAATTASSWSASTRSRIIAAITGASDNAFSAQRAGAGKEGPAS